MTRFNYFFCLVTILPTKSQRLLQAHTVSHGHHIGVRSWGSVVGAEIIGYGINSRAIGVRFPTGARYFFVCSEAPTPTMGPSQHLYSQRTEGSSPGGQAAKAWSWPLTPCKAKVTVGRYLQLLSRLHGVYGSFTFSSHANKFPLLSITTTTQATCSVQIIRTAWPSLLPITAPQGPRAKRHRLSWSMTSEIKPRS